MRYEYQQAALTEIMTELLGPGWKLNWSVGNVLITSPVWINVPRPAINATLPQLAEWVERVAGDLHEGLVNTAARIRF